MATLGTHHRQLTAPLTMDALRAHWRVNCSRYYQLQIVLLQTTCHCFPTGHYHLSAHVIFHDGRQLMTDRLYKHLKRTILIGLAVIHVTQSYCSTEEGQNIYIIFIIWK